MLFVLFLLSNEQAASIQKNVCDFVWLLGSTTVDGSAHPGRPARRGSPACVAMCTILGRGSMVEGQPPRGKLSSALQPKPVASKASAPHYLPPVTGPLGARLEKSFPCTQTATSQAVSLKRQAENTPVLDLAWGKPLQNSFHYAASTEVVHCSNETMSHSSVRHHR